MEFLTERVYTSLNADDLKVGSKAIVANTIDGLKRYVKYACDTKIISCIMPEYASNRFCSDKECYNLAYLVEEPEEKKLKWQDVKIGDVLYWKSNPSMQFLVTAKSFNVNIDRHIYVIDTWIKDTVLADEYAKVGVLENEHAKVEVGDEDEDD